MTNIDPCSHIGSDRDAGAFIETQCTGLVYGQSLSVGNKDGVIVTIYVSHQGSLTVLFIFSGTDQKFSKKHTHFLCIKTLPFFGCLLT